MVVGQDIGWLVDPAVDYLMTFMDSYEYTALSVLIDPTLVDHAAAIGEEHALKRFPLGWIHDDFDPEKQLYLLHIPTVHNARPAIEALLELNIAEATGAFGTEYRARSVCAWLVNDTDVYATSRWLARAAQVRRPDGKPWPLRYWDPRVLPHLPRVLNAQQWAALASAIQNWFSVSAEGCLLPALNCDAPSKDATPLALKFDERQWAALERIALINQSLKLASDWGISFTPELPTTIDQLIATARQRGFPTDQDALVFVACGLTTHKHFDQYPAVDSALRCGAALGQPLAHIIQQFDDAFWSQIEREQESIEARRA